MTSQAREAPAVHIVVTTPVQQFLLEDCSTFEWAMLRARSACIVLVVGWQSPLSGQVDYACVAWTRRQSWSLLACDQLQSALVRWLNSRAFGCHTVGYAPFCIQVCPNTSCAGEKNSRAPRPQNTQAGLRHIHARHNVPPQLRREASQCLGLVPALPRKQDPTHPDAPLHTGP